MHIENYNSIKTAKKKKKLQTPHGTLLLTKLNVLWPPKFTTLFFSEKKLEPIKLILYFDESIIYLILPFPFRLQSWN